MYLSSQYSESQSQASESTSLLGSEKQNKKFRLNTEPTYGVYNRNDYMARCYRKCWKLNSRIGPVLRKLLCFGGQSSLSGDCCSSFFFVFVIFFPMLSLVTLFPIKRLSYHVKIALASSILTICMVLAIWHIFSLYILTQNKKIWKDSWFTFQVSADKFHQPQVQIADRFFDIRKHLRFYDITRDSVRSFPLLDVKQRQDLNRKFEIERINRARVILYTPKFLESISSFSMKIGVFLLCIALLASGISAFELVMIAKNFKIHKS
uniref:Uncharacterized protein n=1 Tax=Clytia hemisphaerica TaxID=252671 RepID=A0A7M5X6H9_9CNID